MPKRNTGKSREQIIAALQQQLQRLPTLVANLGVNFVKDNFDTESWEGRKWAPRKTGAPRNAGRKLLRDRGTLYRAIRKTVNANRIRVFIAAPADVYGAAHNTGGIMYVRPHKRRVPTGRRSDRAGAYAQVKAQTRKLPKRQFIGQSRFLNQKADALVQQQLWKIIQGL